MPTTTPRRARRLLVGLLAIGLLVPVTGAEAQTKPKPPSLAEARRQREQVRQQRAKVASQINTLQASNRELEQALDDLEDNLKTQQALLADAQRAAEAAEAQLAQAQQVEVAKQAELLALDDQLKQLAVEAYVSPPQDDAFAVFESGDVTTAVRRRALLSFRAGRVVDVMDEAAQVEEDLAAARRAAEQAAAEAKARRAEEAERLGQVETALAEKQSVADKVEERLERALAESQSLAAVDRQLADTIAREQAALAARLARAQARRPRGGGSSASIPIASASEMRTVRGITVHASIADNVAALVDAAAADGLQLAGGGFRDSSSQIALRRSNCGSSQYAIYQAPASSCRPPTARPGASMHERGLAIDFTCNGGGVINSRSNVCYRWLAANASRYGLYNLPSEPWHWSTNGN